MLARSFTSAIVRLADDQLTLSLPVQASEPLGVTAMTEGVS